MSEQEDEFDADGNVIVKPDADGPKALRAALKKAQQERDDLLTEVNTFRQTQKTTTIADALELHGAPKKLARFVAVDVTDPSPDAVHEWLKTNGEDFGWTEEAVDPDEQETRDNAARISRAANTVPPRKDFVLTPEYIKTASVEDLKARGIW